MNTYTQTENQVNALFAARAYLLTQNPTDMVAVAQITEDYISLTQTALAQNGQPSTVKDNPSDIQSLTTAIDTLDDYISCNAGADEVLASTTAIASL